MKRIRWNDGWKFWEDKNSFALVWSVPENARDITLPHDAMIEGKADPDSPNGGNTGFRNGGTCVYVKLFDAPEAWRGKKTEVFFEGVYMNAMVYLNEQLVAHNPYGYTGFTADLSDCLNFGGRNELRVIVRNGAMPNSRWYSGTGIYRDVYLLQSEKTYLVPQGLEIVTENADADLAVLKAGIEIANEGVAPADLKAVTVILDRDGNLAGQETTALFLKAGETRKIMQRIAVENPALWDEDTPYLYAVRTQLVAGGQVLDEEETSYGIRTLSVDAKRGLRVNGKTVLLRGACIHHEFGIIGAAAYYEAAYREVKKLKEAGFNAIRMSHHPMAPVMLRACDELGVYVMDEFSDMWERCKSDYDYSHFFGKFWRRDVEAMVRKDFNHPSVVLYSIGNEIPEIGTNKGSETAHEIADLFHILDDTRYTTAGINGVFAAGDRVPEIMADLAAADAQKDNSGDDKVIDGEGSEKGNSGNVNDFMTVMDTRMDEIVVHRAISERLEKACEALDVAGYNYMTARYEKDLVNYPNRVIVGSETYPPEIARNWAEVKKCPNVIGDFTWTGWDYIGEAGVGIPAYKFGDGGFGAGFPAQLAYAGDIDITGFRRPASYYREIAYGIRKAPYLAVQDPAHYGENLIKTPWVISDASHSWSFPGFEGKHIVVEIYGAGESAELLLNGKSLGKKEIVKPAPVVVGNRALFDITYEPGTLTAVLYDGDGKEIGRDTLVSTGAAGELRAEVEPEYGQTREEAEKRLLYVALNLADADGAPIDSRSYDTEVTVQETQNLHVLGLGSANPKPVHNYNEAVTDTWYGRAQLIAEKIDPDIEARVVLATKEGLRAEITL